MDYRNVVEIIPRSFSWTSGDVLDERSPVHVVNPDDVEDSEHPAQSFVMQASEAFKHLSNGEVVSASSEGVVIIPACTTEIALPAPTNGNPPDKPWGSIPVQRGSAHSGPIHPRVVFVANPDVDQPGVAYDETIRIKRG